MRFLGRLNSGLWAGTLLIALSMYVTACRSTADTAPPSPEGRLRTSPVRVVPAPNNQQYVSLVVAPAQGAGEPTDLTVYVDGQSVPAGDIGSHRASASLVFLVDDSAEMEQRGLSPVADGLFQALTHAVNPHADRLSAIRFSDEVMPRYDYTSPPSFIKRRGLRLEPSGNRCLNLALEAAVNTATAGPMPSRAVLLATSGDDAGGSCGGPDRDSVIAAAGAAGVPIHVVHLGPTADQPELERLAVATGGAYRVLGTADSLDTLAAEVADLLTATRLVTFRTASTGKERAVDIRARVDGTPLAGTMAVRPSDGGPLLTTLVPNNNFGAVSSAADAPGTKKAAVVAAPAAPVAAAAKSDQSPLLGGTAAAGVVSALILVRRRRLRRGHDTPSPLAAVRVRAESERRAADEAGLAAPAPSDPAAPAPVAAELLENNPRPATDEATSDSAAVPALVASTDEVPGSNGLSPQTPTVPLSYPRIGPTPAPGAAAATAPLASLNGTGHVALPQTPAAAGAAGAASRRAQSPEQIASNPPLAGAEPPPFALVGFVCGRYRLEAPLGRGGLGEVYRARDLQFDRTVAVKVLFDTVFEGADAFDSLMREVSLVDRITHPNVVRVYDVIRFEGRVAIVMEYVSGQSLAAITREQGTVSPEDFDAVLTGVAEALDAAHAAGVVHGDVTPGNVIITDEGKVKLCDFGVGRLVGDDPSAPRAGTPRFVAPEVLAGADAGPRGDVYSLGALTLHVLGGREADLATLPAPFARALEGALEPEPNMRCASAGALAVAFHTAVEEEIMRRRGPVRRLVDGFRLRSLRKPPVSNRVELPPTGGFPKFQDNHDASAFLDDPDRTQPLPAPADPYRAPMTTGVTQPLGPRE